MTDASFFFLNPGCGIKTTWVAALASDSASAADVVLIRSVSPPWAAVIEFEPIVRDVVANLP